MKTHENLVFSWFGGLSDTGTTSPLVRVKAVKELGLEELAMGCLGARQEMIRDDQKS